MDDSDSVLFEEEFFKLLKQLTMSDDLVRELEDEIADIRLEIDTNLKNRNISNKELQEIYSRLWNEKKNLVKCQDNLEQFANAKEIAEIQQQHSKCKEKRMQMERVEYFDNYFSKITQLIQSLQQLKSYFESKHFLKANNCLTKANELLDDLEHHRDLMFPVPSTNLNLVEDCNFIHRKLVSYVNLVYEKFIYDLIQTYKENIYFSKINDTSKEQVLRFAFLTSMSKEEYGSFISCVLEHREQFHPYLRNTFEQIDNLLVQPILLEGRSISYADDEGNLYSDNQDLIFDKLKVSETSENKIFDNVQSLIEKLIQLFTMNRNVTNSLELIGLIGQSWTDQLFSCIIKNYFEPRMPRVESEFDQFVEVLQEGQLLEKFLIQIGMIPEETNGNLVLRNYSDNIREHFSAKISQDFIIRTKRTLKLDQNDLIGSDFALENCPFIKNNKFPLFQVSRFMMEIRIIFEEMSQLLETSSSNLKLLIVETFGNVCELFVDISPFVFKLNIELNPRQNAIFHNNCLLFGYIVESVIQVHKPRLDLLKDYISVVRSMASQVFMNQMQHQEKLLVSFIANDIFRGCLHTIADEIPSTDLKISSQSHFELRQCINQCLSHLNTLHSAFVDILPEKICGRTFNTLITSFLTEFIQRILELNDISSLGASHLSHELDYFSKELKLFLAHSDSLVSKWMKMNEINFILKVNYELINHINQLIKF